MTKIVMFWFRRDLRLEDNRGLSRALRSAAEMGASVVPIFIFDQRILSELEDEDDARVGFIHKTIEAIKETLRAQGSDLIVWHGRPQDFWKSVAENGLGLPGGDQVRVVKVIANHDYEPRARKRDEDVAKQLAASGIAFETFKDQVIFERSEVVKDDGKPYTVFTPFSKRWRSVFEDRRARGVDELAPEVCGTHFRHLLKFSNAPLPTLREIGFRENTKIELPGVRVATSVLVDYAKNRNTPSLPGTTRLGLHLRFGTVSIRKLVRLAMELNADVWLSELIWREFFMQILFHFPHVDGKPFRPEYDRIVWRNDEAEFQAWCEGRTGYPIVDAGMRELNETGFMHNRVRMIVGSFLSKHLLIDWRWGEAYFARKLLDFELSANNGNWQWVAGSGCDAAPYFRVFNPTLQAEKFDPDQRYISQWVPEFSSKEYPPPMVDHAMARARVLKAYEVLKK
ncbi:MAG: deoxyribodipyrimidine photo-lyase [Bdellovibrionales bacterium]|nr:deoxyribodipyrimidine photo-lyase [Bdellovibrionales bacterium]